MPLDPSLFPTATSSTSFVYISAQLFLAIERNVQQDVHQHLDAFVKTFYTEPLFLCDFFCEDESKISNMLTETRRNREMCNQIARKVFFNQSHTTKVAPVGPDVSMMVLTVKGKLTRQDRQSVETIDGALIQL